MRHCPAFLIALLLPLVSGVAMADVYKWKDANGSVHYSDVPIDGAVLVKTSSRYGAVGGQASIPAYAQTRTPPPSPEMPLANVGNPRWLATRLAIKLSSRWLCLLPQPLKPRSETAKCPEDETTNDGPESLAQRSSVFIGQTSMPGPSDRVAGSICSGLANTTTRSNLEIACAIRAIFPRTVSSAF